MKFLKSVAFLVVTIFLSFNVLFALRSVSKPLIYQAYDADVKYGDTKNNTKAKYEAIIRLKTAEGDGFCTGFVIDGAYAMTAAHCVDWMEKNADIRVFDKANSDTGTVAHVLGYNKRNDSAVIAGDFREFKAVRLEKDTNGFLNSRGPFRTCGYPYDQKKLYCSYAMPVSMENFSVRLIGALIPGMSGGPVFDAVTGRVVGLNTAVDGPYIIVNPITGVLGSFGLDN